MTDTNRTRLLLVEDDAGMAESLVEGLDRYGFAATHVTGGAGAVAAAREVSLVLLDLNLPDADGKDVCRQLRQESNVPIIVITARADEIDRVLLLELGADDYLVKPFGLRELVARIHAVLRRSQPSVATSSSDDVIVAGSVTLSLRSRRVTCGDATIDLTPKEFDLLVLFAREPGVVHRREDIMDSVWDPHWFGPTKTLDVHVASLRRKLHDAVAIEAVRGVGYRLEVPA